MWPFSFLRPRLDSLFIYTWTLLLKRDKRAHVQYMPHSCPQHSTPPKKVQCSAIHCNGLRPEKRRAGAACFCKKTIVHPSVCWTVDCSWRAMFQWSTLTTPLHTVFLSSFCHISIILVVASCVVRRQNYQHCVVAANAVDLQRMRQHCLQFPFRRDCHLQPIVHWYLQGGVGGPL